MIKLKLRSEPSYGVITGQNIDRENDMIHDVVVMMGNAEALGHGIMTDIKTLHMTAALGNENARGIPSRFGHPGMSENTLGKKVGFSRNFQVRGDRLYADIKMMPAARRSPVFTQDPLEYLYQVAEQNPQDMGMSVVIDTDLVWVMPDGTEESALDEYGFIEYDSRPENALNELPIMRPMFFFFNDFVAEGALTHDGLFGQRERLFSDRTGSGYAELAFEFLDVWRQKFNIPLSEVPQKADNLIQFYLKARRKQDMAVKRKRLNEEISELDQAILELDEDAETVASVEPVSESESAPDLDQTLETAESTADELREQPVEPEPAVAELKQQLAVLQHDYATLQDEMEKMKKLMAVLASNDQVLTRRVKRLETEPIVTDSVLSVPVPSRSLAKQQPESVFQRSEKAGSAIKGKTSPLATSIERTARRKQLHPGATK